MFEFGAEQVYVAIEGESFYVTDDPLDRHVVAAARSTREVERAGEELVLRLRALSPRTS